MSTTQQFSQPLRVTAIDDPAIGGWRQGLSKKGINDVVSGQDLPGNLR
jgi:hypothetical protein